MGRSSAGEAVEDGLSGEEMIEYSKPVLRLLDDAGNRELHSCFPGAIDFDDQWRFRERSIMSDFF